MPKKYQPNQLTRLIQSELHNGGDTYQALEDYYNMKHWKYSHQSLRRIHDWLIKSLQPQPKGTES